MENTACVAVEEQGRWLLVRRGNPPYRGWWCFPGGHAEEDESGAQTAAREAREEVGGVALAGAEPILVFEHEWPADSRTPAPHRHRCQAFRGRVDGGIVAGDDAAEARWFEACELSALDLTSYTRTVAEHLGLVPGL